MQDNDKVTRENRNNKQCKMCSRNNNTRTGEPLDHKSELIDAIQFREERDEF